jgi:hypothetical protein
MRMDESSPPRTTPRHRRRAIAATVTGVLVVGSAATAYMLSRPADRRSVADPVSVSMPPVVPPAAPKPAPTQAPPPPAIPHDRVAAAAPTAFTLAGRGFTIKAHVCSMDPIFPLDPPGEQHHTVCWVKKGFGVTPGSNTATTYVLGHSWAEDTQEVLNDASAVATREVLHEKAQLLDGVPVYPAKALTGSRITLRTPSGTLVYEVRDAYGVNKLKLGSIARVMNQKVRKRIVLITCAELHGVDYDDNIVLDARLVSSKRA